MKELLIAILKALNIEQKDIDSVVATKDEDVAAFKPDDIISKVKDGMKVVFLNDDSFLGSIPEDKVGKDILKKIESGQYAKFQNELVEVATKKLGLDDKVVFTDDDRKSIKKLAEKMAVGYLAKNNNTAGLQEMQKQLADATEALTKKDEEITTKVSQKETEVLSKTGVRIINTLAKLELGSLDKIKLNVKPDYIIGPVLQKVASKYDAVLVVGDDDVVHMKQKKNNALAVVGADNKEVTFASALRTIVLEDKLGEEVKEEGGAGGSGGRRKISVEGGGEGGGEEVVEVPDYINKKIAANPDPVIQE